MENKKKIGNTIIKNNQPIYNPTYKGLMTVEDAINKYKAFFEKLDKLNNIDCYTELEDRKYSIKHSLKLELIQYLRKLDKSLKISVDYTDFTFLYNIIVFDYFNFKTEEREKRTLDLSDYFNGDKKIEEYSLPYYALKLKNINELIDYVIHLNKLIMDDRDYAPSRYNKLVKIFPIRLQEGDYITAQIDVQGNIHFKLIDTRENQDNVIIPLEDLSPKKRKKIFSMAVDKDSIPNYLDDESLFEHFYEFNDDFEYISDEYYEFIDLEKELLNLKPKSATVRPEWLDELIEYYSVIDPSIAFLKEEKVNLEEEIKEKEKEAYIVRNDEEVTEEKRIEEQKNEKFDNLNITGCVLSSGASIIGSGIASFAFHTPTYLIPGGICVAGSIITLRTLNKIIENIRHKKNYKVYFNEKKQEDLKIEIESLRESYTKCLQTIQDMQISKELIRYIIEKFDVENTEQNYEGIKCFEIEKDKSLVKSF